MALRTIGELLDPVAPSLKPVILTGNLETQLCLLAEPETPKPDKPLPLTNPYPLNLTNPKP